MPDKPDKERDEEGTEFKVTDRRMFTADGERRADIEPEAEKAPPKAAVPPPPKPPVQPPASHGKPQAPPAQAAPEREGPVSFEHLVMSLATTAMFQLGLVKGPGNESPPVDLPAAKETLDLLDILQQKTKGNLSEHEEELLSGSLYELRMVFVEIAKKSGRVR
jgi:hypothetical protein